MLHHDESPVQCLKTEMEVAKKLGIQGMWTQDLVKLNPRFSAQTIM